MQSTLTAVIHEAVLKSGKADGLGKRLGKAYPTLMRQLNPNDDGTFFNADHVLAAMEETGSDSPLVWLASMRGYLLVPLPRGKVTCLHLETDLARMSKEVSQVVIDFSKAVEDGKITEEEARNFNNDVREACGALVHLAEEMTAAVGKDLAKFQGED
jgi:hypothetical protein